MKRYHEGLTTADYEIIDARLGLIVLDGGISNQAPADLRDRGLPEGDVPFEADEQMGLFQ